MRKLLAYCRRAPQLTVVILAFPFIVAFYSCNLPILATFNEQISHLSQRIFDFLNLDYDIAISLSVGKTIIAILVLYTSLVSLRNMIKNLLRGTLGIDLLAFVALLATLFIGEFWASYLIVVMVWTGEAIEDFAHMKAQRNLSLLVSAAPKTAHLMTLPGIEHGMNHNQANDESYEPPCLSENQCKPSSCVLCQHAEFRKVDAANSKQSNSSEQNCESNCENNNLQNCNCKRNNCPFLQASADGEITSNLQRYATVAVDDLKVGNIIIVLPGETVPVDGELLSGSAILDTSAINGESVPREVYAGGAVLSGCVNGGVVLIMRVTKLSKNSQYQKIMQLVESARSSKAAVVRFADMLSVPFTVLSFAIAGLAWGFSGDALRFAQVLVLATPCPLLIAVPVACMAGTGRLAKLGIVVKSQDVLEQLSRVTDVFFDKTGTLTVKQPQVARVDVVDSMQKADRIVMLAGVLETYSQHILAGGIAKAGAKLWENAHPSSVPQLPSVREYPVVHSVKETAGQGIQGVVDGILVRVGRHKYVTEQNTNQTIGKSLAADEMATYVSFDGVLVGRIVLKDVPRDNAKSTIASLRALGVRTIAMLTGDGLQAATTIGKSVGIDSVHADLLPQDKLAYVKKHNYNAAKNKKDSTVTMMVGDGVNDAPVLAAADIGVAVTDGTDTAASECAQVVIMNNNIAAVASAISVAKHTKHVMIQSVLLGIGLAIISMILAAFGFIPAVLGAMMQEVIDVISITWALTALRSREKMR
ncbi:heavy metal translocating P-type ATPase [Gardnerella vaginalis]|uniref:Heavy metal translocating P-type ATPase n=1 Tax=Gardnerella vaginalis TaxID=2702 RepID=A0A133P320_GARVA|nr:heavy metal translocating P-type ATPase [Gardnerella vaginalis]EPI41279.1 heavy metal translocating P-type ATPase [Gardnerella vaginalis JCP8481B]EPI44780.1 heavy metal translocating P-type ATPase [Gardnerella vaginalis JCP8481A]KXA22876.1 heavy metal translocating P-type ATPase [Gardnerella vaginalis]